LDEIWKIPPEKKRIHRVATENPFMTFNKAINGGYQDIAAIDWPTWINAGEFPIMPYKIALFLQGVIA
jgi:hypothetical protein